MAADGEEAVRKACALVPDIVVLDASGMTPQRIPLPMLELKIV